MPERTPERSHIPGEGLDEAAHRIVQLVHSSLNKAGGFRKKHERTIGIAAKTVILSSSALIVANYAINKFLSGNPHATNEEVVSTMTDEHLHETEKIMRHESRLQRANRVIREVAKHVH